jgi:hypothetical protein
MADFYSRCQIQTAKTGEVQREESGRIQDVQQDRTLAMLMFELSYSTCGSEAARSMPALAPVLPPVLTLTSRPTTLPAIATVAIVPLRTEHRLRPPQVAPFSRTA